MAGEWTTFNEAVKVMESFYGLSSPLLEISIISILTRTKKGRSLPLTNISHDDIRRNLVEYEKNGDAEKYVLAQVDEWMVCGGCTLPKEKTLRQREKYFSKVKFSTLEELLKRAETTDFL